MPRFNLGQVAILTPDGLHNLKKSFFFFCIINNCCIRIVPWIIDDILTGDNSWTHIKTIIQMFAKGHFV